MFKGGFNKKKEISPLSRTCSIRSPTSPSIKGGEGDLYLDLKLNDNPSNDGSSQSLSSKSSCRNKSKCHEKNLEQM